MSNGRLAANIPYGRPSAQTPTPRRRSQSRHQTTLDLRKLTFWSLARDRIGGAGRVMEPELHRVRSCHAGATTSYSVSLLASRDGSLDALA